MDAHEQKRFNKGYQRALNDAAQHRNSLEAYLTALFSPHLIASPLKDSTVVRAGYLVQSRPSNDYWMVNNN